MESTFFARTRIS